MACLQVTDKVPPSRHAQPARTLDVTVLMGGPSQERDVSLISGSGIADALQREGHRVTRADISPEDTSALDRDAIDLVFIALHGDFGESGEVQQLCEQRSLPYTASGPRASQLAMDKHASKNLFKLAGLATPDWVIVEKHDPPAKTASAARRLRLPVVVKPVAGGSSLDITIARSQTQRDDAVEDLLRKYPHAMLERYVEGREITVGILGNDALPVLEIVPSREFFDYEAKYSDDAGTRYVLDHGISPRICRHASDAALTAHNALGCRDMSRVDFILDQHGIPQVLELNTIPGFTSHSLLPMAAAGAGLDFQQLVARIAQMALARRNARRAKKERDSAHGT